MTETGIVNPEIIRKIQRIHETINQSRVEKHTFIPESQYNKLLEEINKASEYKVETCGLLVGGLIPSLNRILITQVLIPPETTRKQDIAHCEISLEYLKEQSLSYYKSRQETIIGRWHLHYGLEEFSSTDLSGVKDFLSVENYSWHPYHVELLCVKHTSSIKLLTSFFIPKIGPNEVHFEISGYDFNPTIVLPDTVFNTLKPWFWDKNEIGRIVGTVTNHRKWKQTDIIQTGDEVIIKTKTDNRILYFPHNYSPALYLEKNRKKHRKHNIPPYDTITDLDAFLKLSLSSKKKNIKKK